MHRPRVGACARRPFRCAWIVCLFAMAFGWVQCASSGHPPVALQGDLPIEAREGRLVGLDGMEMVVVPGGRYLMGDNGSYDCPAHEVVVSSFLMDVHEVTVRQYAAFVRATGRGPPAEVDRAEQNQPVIVTWEAAAAYAEHYGKRLPTEAEFEWALRGGRVENAWPWGEDPVPPKGFGNYAGEEYAAEFRRTAGVEFHGHFKDWEDGFPGLAPVRSHPPNSFGIYDISGNAWEWCQDWYDHDYFRRSPVFNPKGPEKHRFVVLGEGFYSLGGRVVRGGGWDCGPEFTRVCARYYHMPYDERNVGFRCVIPLAAGARWLLGR